MIHPDEMLHIEAARAARKQRDEDFETITPPFNVPNEEDHKAMVRQWSRDAKRMARECPWLWEAMSKLHRPGPHLPIVGQPSVEMTFGEHAAYRMGQDSVWLWLNELFHNEDEDDG